MKLKWTKAVADTYKSKPGRYVLKETLVGGAETRTGWILYDNGIVLKIFREMENAKAIAELLWKDEQLWEIET